MATRPLPTVALTALAAVIAMPLAAAQQPLVVVSIAPQQVFVQRVGGDRVRVELLLQPGHSPATYEPSPKQMARLADAKLWIRIGVPFERSVLRNVAGVAPGLEVVDGRRGIDLTPMDAADADHHGGDPDPHFWLDPLLVGVHAETIRSALCGHLPDHCDEFTSNLKALRTELENLHEQLAVTLAPFAGRDLYVFHPAYGYFARRYGLHQVAVEHGGKAPTGRQLAILIERARVSGTRSMFVQPQFAGSGALAVAETLGVETVELDPLAADYFVNLDAMAKRIAAAYGE